jgi:hypothetical protein
MNSEFRRRLRRASRAVPLAIEPEGLERQVHQIGRFPTDIAHSCDLPRLIATFFGHIISPDVDATRHAREGVRQICR